MPATPATSPRLGAPRFANGDAVDFAGQVNSITDAVDAGVALLAAGFQPGDLKPSAVTVPQTGWLLCDGSAVARTGATAALFAAIGTTYGTGNGSTTFNVPDLRGRVPVGVDGAAGRLAANDALGNSGGTETHALTTSEIPAHQHPIWFTDGDAGSFSATFISEPKERTGTRMNVVDDAGGGGAHTNMQPFAIVNWFIKT
jgi:microcystin-dependent protein